MTWRHGLVCLAAVLEIGCASGGQRCLAVFVDRADLSQPTARPALPPPCVWLTHPQDLPNIPRRLRFLDPNERTQFLRQIREADQLFFSAGPQEGARAISDVIDRMRSRTEWLPTAPKDRALTYGVVATWMRLKAEAGEPGAVQESALWLAVHMSDQQPSVRSMPPELELLASRMLERVRASHVKIDIEPPAECQEPAGVFMDGLALGTLPLHIMVPLGEHTFWVQCGSLTSWVRVVGVEAPLRLTGIRMHQESSLGLGPEFLQWRSSQAPIQDPQLLRSVATWAGIDAVVMPGTVPGELAVAMPDKVVAVTLGESQPLELPDFLERPHALRWAAAGSAGLAAVLAAGGVWANLEYNDLVQRTNGGVVDGRDEAAPWQTGAQALYLSAGAALAAGVGFLIWDWVTAPAEAEPLFIIETGQK